MVTRIGPRPAFPWSTVMTRLARPRRLRPVLATALSALLVATAGAVVVASAPDTADTAETGTASTEAAVRPVAARAANPATPGDFTGYGFDQCLAPDQAKMDAWLAHSPFLAVGIYISGDSRACRSQPNLTPTWISTQLAKGWRLLPITLGPQASCQPRFPRYDDDRRIDPTPGKNKTYGKARKMGRLEAVSTVADAKALGIVPGSTLWYDLEGYDNTNTHCRESALQFLSGWTRKLHALDYVSGVYSSASSGIKALDDARVSRPGKFVLPDRLWIARWDGVANTSTSYLREDGWRPGGRVKQYRGGHDETWGGVTINIDSNFLDVGKGSVAARESRCGGVNVSFRRYAPIRRASATYTPGAKQVKALQCLLQERGLYRGKLNGRYNPKTVAAARAWQQQAGLAVRDAFLRRHWIALLSAGSTPVLKHGSAGEGVRRLQRALNAAQDGVDLRVNGVFAGSTTTALKAWQSRVGHPTSGVATPATWRLLALGKRR